MAMWHLPAGAGARWGVGGARRPTSAGEHHIRPSDQDSKASGRYSSTLSFVTTGASRTTRRGTVGWTRSDIPLAWPRRRASRTPSAAWVGGQKTLASLFPPLVQRIAFAGPAPPMKALSVRVAVFS